MTGILIATLLLSVTSLAFLLRAIAQRQWRSVWITLSFVMLGIGAGWLYPHGQEMEIRILGRSFASAPLFAYIGAVFGGTLGLVVSALARRDEGVRR